MNVQEVATRWGVHYNTVFKLIRAGTLKARERRYRSEGIEVDESEVLRFEKERRMPEDAITAEDTMEMLGCSRHLLAKYVALGVLKPGRIVESGRMYFSRREVEEAGGYLSDSDE
jgi:predicted site-specific integrase-resolvase